MGAQSRRTRARCSTRRPGQQHRLSGPGGAPLHPTRTPSGRGQGLRAACLQQVGQGPRLLKLCIQQGDHHLGLEQRQQAAVLGCAHDLRRGKESVAWGGGWACDRRLPAKEGDLSATPPGPLWTACAALLPCCPVPIIARAASIHHSHQRNPPAGSQAGFVRRAA